MRMGTRGRERLIPVRIIGDLDEDLEDLVKDIWDEDKGKTKRRSLLVTHEDGTTEENPCTVSQSSWRRETCPASPPLEISTLPPTPAPSASPGPQVYENLESPHYSFRFLQDQPSLAQSSKFVPGYQIMDSQTLVCGLPARGQTMEPATPIHIQRETNTVGDEEEDIYSPQSVSLPNLSPISSTTSSPQLGLSPSLSLSSWTVGDEETMQDLSQGQGDEEWDGLDDVVNTLSPFNPPRSYKVHIDLERDEALLGCCAAMMHPPKVTSVSAEERVGQTTPCKSRAPLTPPPPTRHPVRIVPINLHRPRLDSANDSLKGTERGEEPVVSPERKFFKQDEQCGAGRLRPGHKCASSLGGGGGVWAVPINIQEGEGGKEVGGDRHSNTARTERRSSRERVSVPVQVIQREVGSLLVHQSSEETLSTMVVPEKTGTAGDLTQPQSSKKGPCVLSQVLRGGTAKSPPDKKELCPATVTVDPFSYTHLPFSLPPQAGKPPSRFVNIQREAKGGNYAGSQELVKVHDGLEVTCDHLITTISIDYQEAKGKLTAQAERLTSDAGSVQCRQERLVQR